MAIGKSFCRRDDPDRRWRLALGAAFAALLLGLGACSPVETWRNLTGASKNDPNPATTPNTKNLAAGEAESYPNLATVPAPPTQELTTAELDTLTKNLIADRTHVKYTDQQLRAGFDQGSPPPPPPPPEPPAPPAGAAAASATNARVVSAAATAPAAAPNAAAQGARAQGAPTGRGSASAPSTQAVAAKGPRKAGQPPEPGPMESGLTSPQMPSLPQPAMPEPAPPPPRVTAARPPAPAPLPGALGSAAYEPPPPAPSLAPKRTAMAAPGLGEPANAAGAVIAEIQFAAGSTTLSDTDRAALAKLALRYRERKGRLRIVGYAGAGGGAKEELASYRAALDRAQTVATALSRSGIPADRISVEASPKPAAGDSRAEVRFVP